jgi:hypothetical protein
MFEFHGWAIIRESPKNSDDTEKNIKNIIMDISNFIKKLNWENNILEVKELNGSYHFYTTGLLNHRSQEVEELMDLYKYISKIAPGSYGLLYTYNDEDKNGFDNEFRVIVLRRGKLQIKEDNYLSPFIPTLEDEFE